MLQRATDSIGLRATSEILLCDDQTRAGRARRCRRAAFLTAQTSALLLLLLVFCARFPQVAGHSMEPHIRSGDHVLIDTLAYDLRVGVGASRAPIADLRLRDVARGDVVAFFHQQNGERRLYLKRVKALAGDSVRAGGATITVPPHAVFVLGDNPSESDDSRTFGAVPVRTIVGRAVFIVWPLDRVRVIN